ncbi:MAG: peptidase vanX D-ala-D-ala dipeptidase [Verrucomicrobiales bacterium]|nr:peptidase vanX D-ala-D-ala dipeptidase [Verrucomicrobiales bacterium]
MKRLFPLCLSFFVFVISAIAKPDDLVNVEKEIPGIVLDIRYATTNNFTKQAVYPMAKCYLRSSSAEKLKAVQKDLKAKGLGLKIYDGYRPLSVQKKFWALVPDDRYVANPAKGSRHNRGAAVDLTIIKKDGTELQMPTPYDDFTEKAHRDYKDLPAVAIKNRQLLEDVMTKHGFVGITTEWWHFDDVDWKNYDIMDIDFEKLK